MGAHDAATASMRSADHQRISKPHHRFQELPTHLLSDGGSARSPTSRSYALPAQPCAPARCSPAPWRPRREVFVVMRMLSSAAILRCRWCRWWRRVFVNAPGPSQWTQWRWAACLDLSRSAAQHRRSRLDDVACGRVQSSDLSNRAAGCRAKRCDEGRAEGPNRGRDGALDTLTRARSCSCGHV